MYSIIIKTSAPELRVRIAKGWYFQMDSEENLGPKNADWDRTSSTLLNFLASKSIHYSFYNLLFSVLFSEYVEKLTNNSHVKQIDSETSTFDYGTLHPGLQKNWLRTNAVKKQTPRYRQYYLKLTIRMNYFHDKCRFRFPILWPHT